MFGLGRLARWATLFAFALLLTMGAAPRALAQDCNADVAKLSTARDAQMASINGYVASQKGKPLDPAAFCARTGGLLAAENRFIAYMVKNKDWCQIPDDAIGNLKKAHASSQSLAARACSVAAQKRKLETQQAQGGGAGPGVPQAVPLPTGPL